MTSIIAGLFLLAWSFMFAMLEIAIEGPVGWALTAPTWRKKSRLYSAVMGGKELTGYHLWMFFLPVLLLHLPFVFAAHWGVNTWTLGRELELLAYYFLLGVHWDFLWFVMNPSYGIRRFRRGEIWWHQHWVWRVPTDYFFAVALAVGLVAGAQFVGEGVAVWSRAATVVVVLVFGLMACIFFGREIRRWHMRMPSLYRLGEGWTSDERTRLLEMFGRLANLRVNIADIGAERARREQLPVEE